MRNIIYTVVVIACLFPLHALGESDLRDSVSYAGELTGDDGRLLPNGSYDALFKIYDSEKGKTPIWSEEWSDENAVIVTNGTFRILLGGVDPENNPLEFYTNENLWLEVWLKRDGRYEVSDVRIKINPPSDFPPVTEVPYAPSTPAAIGSPIGATSTKTGDIKGGTATPITIFKEVSVTGTVIIGASRPANGFRMDVRGSAIFGNQIKDIDGSASSVLIGINDRNTGFYDPGDNAIQIANNGVDTVRIDRSGNVGIGTTAPTDKLQIRDGGIKLWYSPQAKLRWMSDDYHMLRYAHPDFGDNYFGEAMAAYGGFYLFTGTSSTATKENAKFTIQPDGKVGIGTVFPSAQLHVAGTSYFGDVVTFANAEPRIDKSVPRLRFAINGDKLSIGYHEVFDDFEVRNIADGNDKVIFNVDRVSQKATAMGELCWGEGFHCLGANGGGGNAIMTGYRGVGLIMNGAGDGAGTKGVFFSHFDTPTTISAGNTQPVQITTRPETSGDLEVVRLYVSSATGNVGIGTTDPQYKLDIAGKVRASEGYDCPHADLAEKLPVGAGRKDIDPATVVVLTKDGIIPASSSYDARLAGVISTEPAVKMGSEIDGNYVALSGTVPCKVTGKISAGDMLTTSDISGHAMKADKFVGGAMVGKALENFSGKSGIIRVWIGGI